MKNIKVLSVALFVGIIFIGCETNTVNDEVGMEDIETLGTGEESGSNEIEDENRTGNGN